ncbi:MAG TPA: hypothetical protein VD931_11165 [Baekduia sp.]|nr:hypothetical protein [Baekduia sp.]
MHGCGAAAWSFSTNDPGSIGHVDGCSTGDGLQVFEQLATGKLAHEPDHGWWTFAAPPKTAITAFRAKRYLHTYADPDWHAAIRADDVLLEDCHVTGPVVDCYRGSAGGTWQTFDDLDAQRVSVGGFCRYNDESACGRGSTLHRLETYLYDATVTISDPEPPSSSLSTPAADGAWHSGAIDVTTAADDNTGVRERRLELDGQPVATIEAPSAQDGGCRSPGEGVAWTVPLPCGGARGINGTVTRTFAVGTWPEGAGELRSVAVDTGGNETASSPVTVRIDHAPPATPAVSVQRRWTAGAPVLAFDVPAQAAAPVVRADVRVCPAARDCVQRTVAAGAGLRELALDEVPAGDATAAVRLVDAAGNLGAWSAPVAAGRDEDAPHVTAVSPAGGDVPDGAPLHPSAQASDATSGVAAIEVQVSVDGGPWRPAQGTFIGEGGRSYALRARATDLAGTTSAWTVGAPVTVRRGERPATGTPGPGTERQAAPAGPPARCRVVLREVRRLRGGRLLIRVAAPPGRSVRATLTAGRRAWRSAARADAAGRATLRLAAVRTRARRAVLRVASAACENLPPRTVRVAG